MSGVVAGVAEHMSGVAEWVRVSGVVEGMSGVVEWVLGSG